MNMSKSIVNDHPCRNTPYDLPYFQIIYNTKKIKNIPLSPMLETKEQAREMAAVIKKVVPEIRLVNPIWLFNSADEHNRQFLLTLIVKAEEWEGYKPEYSQQSIAGVKKLLSDTDDPIIQEAAEDLRTLLANLYKLIELETRNLTEMA